MQHGDNPKRGQKPKGIVAIQRAQFYAFVFVGIIHAVFVGFRLARQSAKRRMDSK